MKQKLQLALVAITLLVSFNAKADTIKNTELNLNNPDVRKCLLDSSKTEGWKLASVYLNDDKKIVMIFDNGNDTREYTSNQEFSL